MAPFIGVSPDSLSFEDGLVLPLNKDVLYSLLWSYQIYIQGGANTEDAGLDVTAGIPVKLCIAHGKSRLEVGSGFPIEAYGSREVSRPSLVIGNS